MVLFALKDSLCLQCEEWIEGECEGMQRIHLCTCFEHLTRAAFIERRLLVATIG